MLFKKTLVLFGLGSRQGPFGWSLWNLFQSVGSLSPLFFFLLAIYLLNKPCHLSDGISYIGDFASYIPVVKSNMCLWPLHFFVNKELDLEAWTDSCTILVQEHFMGGVMYLLLRHDRRTRCLAVSLWYQTLSASSPLWGSPSVFHLMILVASADYHLNSWRN